jgi:Protein of unknown function (DUF3631)
MTGNTLPGAPEAIKWIGQRQLDEVWRELFPARKGGNRDADPDEWPDWEVVTAVNTLEQLPKPLQDKFRKALAANPRLRARWEGDTEGLNDTSGSARDLALAHHLRRHGFTLDEYASIAWTWEHGKAEPDGRHYARCWARTAPAEPPKSKPKPAQIDVETLAERAKADAGAAFEPEALDFMKHLRASDPAAYHRARARLKAAGVRIGALEDEIERRPEPPGGTPGKGKALELPEPEPWREPIDGAELLTDLVAQIRRFVILPEHEAVAVALWCVHAHAHEAAFHSPRLTLTSPTMRCGKSTLLRTVGRLIPRPLPSANITPAAMFRVVEACKPSLLIDEADSFAHENEELRGVINSSHCRFDAFVIRAVPAGDDYEARRFSTWAPMAIASIGRIAATIADRSITIRMERKPPGKTIARMRADLDDGFGALVSKAARWGVDHLDALRAADPDAPAALNDRQADNWRPLLAIAEMAAADWASKARAAALALSRIDEDADTMGVQLLGDIRTVFASTRAEAIWTEDLLRHLHAMSEAPWGEYGHQRKPITPRQLSNLLKPFGITVRQIWMPDAKANKQGYDRGQFASGWTRYLSPSPLEATASAARRHFSSPSEHRPLGDSEPPETAETASSRVLGDSDPPSDDGAYLEHFEMTIDDLDRMAGEGDEYAEVDEWLRP